MIDAPILGMAGLLEIFFEIEAWIVINWEGTSVPDKAHFVLSKSHTVQARHSVLFFSQSLISWHACGALWGCSNQSPSYCRTSVVWWHPSDALPLLICLISQDELARCRRNRFDLRTVCCHAPSPAEQMVGGQLLCSGDHRWHRPANDWGNPKWRHRHRPTPVYRASLHTAPVCTLHSLSKHTVGAS